MTISRPSGKPSFLAWIIPVMPDTMLWCFQRSALIAIMIADGEFSTELNNHPDLVRQLGFTHAEAKLADLLVQGKSLTEASDELGVTRNTVRSQLAQLFIKTDTHRQGELLRVLLQTTIVGQ
jgi:DNA-binding CsgD family transcriptional regulator